MKEHRTILKSEWAFIEQILEERDRQDDQWGGPKHDDKHTYVDWIRFIHHQIGSLIQQPGSAGQLQRMMRKDANFEAFERRMVKVAALALAAVESQRRATGRESASNEGKG